MKPRECEALVGAWLAKIRKDIAVIEMGQAMNDAADAFKEFGVELRIFEWHIARELIRAEINELSEGGRKSPVL